MSRLLSVLVWITALFKINGEDLNMKEVSRGRAGGEEGKGRVFFLGW